MVTGPIKAVASGAIFGAALTAAGVFSPAVIIGQMRLVDFHMLKAFLAASASSACVSHFPYFFTTNFPHHEI